MQKFKDPLKACFENVNIMKWNWAKINSMIGPFKTHSNISLFFFSIPFFIQKNNAYLSHSYKTRTVMNIEHVEDDPLMKIS